jgi:hypothetical protein
MKYIRRSAIHALRITRQGKACGGRRMIGRWRVVYEMGILRQLPTIEGRADTRNSPLLQPPFEAALGATGEER